MDEDEVFERLTEIDMTARTDKTEAFEELAKSLPVGEHGRASFFICAGDHRQMRGEYDEARRLFELALAGGGESAADPLAYLLGLALATGNEPEVQSLSARLRELVRADRVTATTCVHVEDSFDGHGRLREAMRWFTMPLTWGDLDVDELDYLCLVGRHRVRRELD